MTSLSQILKACLYLKCSFLQITLRIFFSLKQFILLLDKVTFMSWRGVKLMKEFHQFFYIRQSTSAYRMLNNFGLGTFSKSLSNGITEKTILFFCPEYD